MEAVGSPDALKVLIFTQIGTPGEIIKAFDGRNQFLANLRDVENQLYASDILREDVGVDGDAQSLSQLAWMLFLKIFDVQVTELEMTCDDSTRIAELECH